MAATLTNVNFESPTLCRRFSIGGSTRVGRSTLTVSVLFQGVSSRLTKFFQYREDFARGALEVVVDNDVGGQIMAFGQLVGRTGESFRDVLVAVAARAQSLLESHHRGRQDQKDHRFGVLTANLLGALDLDFEQHVLAWIGRGHRRAVEVAVKLGPLEESVIVDRSFEILSLDEHVLLTFFGAASRTRRPTSREPEPVVARHEALG